MNRRWEHIAYIAVFFGAIALLSVGGLVRADRRSSSLEQRSLAQRPSVVASEVVTGDYGPKVESYLSDQFLARDRWVKAYTVFSLRALGKIELNGAVVGRNGVLLGDLTGQPEFPPARIPAEMNATMAQFDALDAAVRSYGGKLLVVGHPTKNSFLRADYPPGFGFPQEFDRIGSLYAAALARRGIAFLDMAPIFAQHRDEKLYYDTDHHWTFRGAFLTYTAMMEKLGIRPLAESDLDEVTLPNKFTGSFNRKMAMAFPQSEKVTIATPKVPIAYTRTQDGAAVQDFFRAHPKGSSVAYGIYDDGDHAEVTVATNRPELPSLLMVGDSYTNAIETLVWTGFDESRFLDLRKYTEMSLVDYVKLHKPDRVVVLVRDERYLYRYGNGLFTGTVAVPEADE